MAKGIGNGFPMAAVVSCILYYFVFKYVVQFKGKLITTNDHSQVTTKEIADTLGEALYFNTFGYYFSPTGFI